MELAVPACCMKMQFFSSSFLPSVHQNFFLAASIFASMSAFIFSLLAFIFSAGVIFLSATWLGTGFSWTVAVAGATVVSGQ
jgi:hypothetical protein